LSVQLLPLPLLNAPRWSQLYGSTLALAIAEKARSYSAGPVVVVVDDIAHADRLEAEIRFYSSDQLAIYHLPDWETLPYDVFSPHQGIISERLKTLHHLPSAGAGEIILVPVNTLLQRLCPRSYIASKVQLYSVGQKLNIEDMRRSLEAGGYSCVSQVMEHGEFTVRGAIIDLYPAGARAPYRIDLFDDEIETIRRFDPGSQRSEDKVERIEILPAREFPTDKEAIKGFRERYRQQIEGDPLASRIYTSVSEGLMPSGIEYYLPLFFNELETVFDYLPEHSLYISPDTLSSSIAYFWADLDERYEQRRHDIERPLLPPASLYLETEAISQKVASLAVIECHRHSDPLHPEGNFPVKAPPEPHLQNPHVSPGAALQAFLAGYPGRCLLIAETPGRRESLLSMLHERHIFPKQCEHWQAFLASAEPVCITVADMEQGLLLDASTPGTTITVLSEQQIYGQHAAQKRRRKKRSVDADAIIRNLTDLHLGSPVVHLDHGIGRYLGLQKLSGVGFDTEFLALEYARGDKLYVPVTSLHLISRYTGASPESAPLHTLGTDQWQKARRKAAAQARDVAAELLEIHARRAATQGRSYPLNEDEYNSFIANFPFEETPDQAKAIDSVLADLASPQPMDRVVCGDVGFGKTEVAMRAAFAVASNGRQVAILVPTTLLAQQHFQNFSDRFADWPIRVECLSRFNSAKQQQIVLDELAAGKVDIVIGTHKLLQKSVKFADLGLAIIDEEHRFGVSHKEKLKALRAEVDILTLTATPIPRTLNMSLAGIRDLSIISTPPVARHSINTFVTQWNDVLIEEACQREMKRGGQIYFLHNEVKTIEKIVRDLQALVPEAHIEYAHGQMPEKQLEQVMLDFYHQRFQILVCTTIIESGIDVPTANTIIINRADKLGLAQLHQIRGRVGRSHHRAYAYLFTPPESLLTGDAKKRLDAIESLEDLGVGFSLATHDLEIRGAGELLGENQSGQISEVGFTLYSELLEKAVASLKAGKIPDIDAQLASGVEIDLGIPALIPDDYVYDIHLRLILYKRIASAKTPAELNELRVEFIDRFGLLPDAVKNLFKITELKLATEQIGIQRIEANENGAKIIFSATPNINPAKLIELIQTRSSEYKFNGKETLRIIRALEENERAGAITQLIETLSYENAA
jgi:transcription-repair coupling factor (superfamily II helicase)